jgi:hypothetical protein
VIAAKVPEEDRKVFGAAADHTGSRGSHPRGNFTESMPASGRADRYDRRAAGATVRAP